MYTCKICRYSHSCRCGGKKCKCWMNLWESRTAERLINTYNIEDTKKLVDMVMDRQSEATILKELWIESTSAIASKYEEKEIKETTILDERFARTIWMKSVFCEYPSFNENAECQFCWRRRKDWFRKPCLYYLAKLEEKWIVTTA